MKEVVCSKCGGHEWIEKDGIRTCSYCGTPYIIIDETSATGSGMALSDDIEHLLQKCRADYSNCSKFANLILDLDPGNTEARKYLKLEPLFQKWNHDRKHPKRYIYQILEIDPTNEEALKYKR